MQKLLENPNKLFGYFLNKMGEIPKLRKTNYGYITFNGAWRFFLDTLTITQTKPIKLFNGYDYDSRIEESKYIVVQDEGNIKVQFVLRKVY